MPHVKTIALIAGLAVAGWALTMAILSALARKPSGLGVRDGKLAACPGRLLQADAARVSARPCGPGRRVPRAASHESALR